MRPFVKDRVGLSRRVAGSAEYLVLWPPAAVIAKVAERGPYPMRRSYKAAVFAGTGPTGAGSGELTEPVLPLGGRAFDPGRSGRSGAVCRP